MKGRMRSAWFGACVVPIVALGLGLVVFHSPVAANGPPSFCNTASIAFPAPVGSRGIEAASPYPSNITVSGLSDLVDTVTVTLNNLSHMHPADIDILLVGPEGQTLFLMGDTGSGFDISNVTLTFDDAAAASLPLNSQIVTGTFKSTAQFFGSFPAPAPAPSGATTLATFTGTDPNGTWSLYVRDDDPIADTGSIAGGWCVTITTASVTTLCSTLGDDQPPSLLDQDVFRLTGTSGETVTLTLAADPDGAQTGERATLLLTDQIARVFFARIDSSAVPNTVQATLPATGDYLVTVAEHPDFPRGRAFLGDYCVTLESSGEARRSFAPTAWVEEPLD